MESTKKFFAHSLEGEPPEKWQPLKEHLKNVAELASQFAAKFGGDNWAYLAGLWHDLGKGSLEWQAWLRHVNKIQDELSCYYKGHPSHAFQGAQKIASLNREVGRLLAYCIAGHHTGLANWHDTDSGLKYRLSKNYPSLAFEIQSAEKLDENPPIELDRTHLGFQIQFLTRMLFSCLVDADFLDTERAINPALTKQRSSGPSFTFLHQIFWKKFDELRKNSKASPNVIEQRERVLKACIQAAKWQPGLFSLTVPTGGGKTLASMAFALEHVLTHGMERIIYVIPFTSIIEQTASIFRDMLSKDAVLEHHCNFIPDESDWRTKLAAENWDARIIVTTNVQFFDSFFSNRPSKCRKLHNIANSVIIFDEVQVIPVEKLGPCLQVLRELPANYNSTCLLCTATQPPFNSSKVFPKGLKKVREIVDDVESLFKSLKRTKEEYIGSITAQELAKRLSFHEQVLCIVNTRDQAREIYQELPKSEGNFHLSALMYPAHRSEILQKVRTSLERGQRCRVVSTQLIEAGVDVDFPCVYRAAAGIDSIAQAAGRCNRNGSMQVGWVYIFELEAENPPSFLLHAIQSAKKLFKKFEARLTDPQCVYEYFKDYFWKNEQRMDEDGILALCQQAQSLEIQFKDIAKFQMIKSPTIPVVIALEEECRRLIDKLPFHERSTTILRKLQKFTVQIYPQQLEDIEDWLERPAPDFFPELYVLRSEELYSEYLGLLCKSPQGEGFFI